MGYLEAQMIEHDNVIKLPKNLNSKNFDDEFIHDVNTFLLSSACQCAEVKLDLTGTTWMDLLEAACLPVAAEWIKKETDGVCDPKFLFRLPHKFDKASIGNKTGVRKSNDFYFHFLSWWRVLDTLFDTQFKIDCLLDKDEYVSYDEINNLLKMESDQISPKFMEYITWLKKEWLKQLDINKKGGSLRLLPLTEVLEKNSISDSVARLKKRLEKVKWMGEDERGTMCDSIIYELCENIIDHAYKPKDPLPKTGLMAVRLLADPTGEGEIINRRINPSRVKKLMTYRIESVPERYKDFFVRNRYSGFFEIVVVDGGRGIIADLASLYAKEKGHEGTESEIIDYAFEEGVTRRDKQITPTAGKSLSLLKKKVMNWGKSREDIPNWGGLLEVRSIHGRITYLPGKDPIRTNDLLKFPGVQYRILLPTREQESQAKRKKEIDTLIGLEKRDQQYGLFT